MVKFTENSIIVEIDCKIGSVECWLEIKSSMAKMAMLAMTNTDFPVNEYDPYWFTHVMDCFNKLEFADIKKISESLIVE